MWSSSQTPNGRDFFGHHREGDHESENLDDIEMSEFDENDEDDELCSNFDEVDAISETCFENPHAVELEISGRSQDTITSTQSAPGAVNIGEDKKPLRRPSLATVDELSEDPLPPQRPSGDFDKPDGSLEQLLTPGSPEQTRRSIKGKGSVSSSSLPVDGGQQSRASLATPRPLVHTATSPAIKIPSKLSTNITGKRKEDSLTRRKTQQEFSSESVVRRPKRLSFRRGSSRFQSKFLNDNEDHVIWKPERSPHNVTTGGEPMKKKLSTASITPTATTTDYGVAKSKSWDHPDGSGVSPVSEISPTTLFNDFRLRQQQLIERVKVAREVVKTQNNKLYKPQVSQDDKKKTLKLASRYVSYHISQKPHGLSDIVFQAMDKKKSASPADTDRPLTAKDKWQKAKFLVSSASQHTPEMPRPSVTSLRSNRSELQLVKIHTLGQHPYKPKHPHIGDMKLSHSEHNISELAKQSPPTARPRLQSCATAANLSTRGLEDVDEVDGELETKRADLLSSPLKSRPPRVMAVNSRLENVSEVDGESEDKKQEAEDPSCPPICIDNLNNNNNNSNNNNNNNVNSSSAMVDRPQGHGWSGSIHHYDNPIARFSQLYVPGSSSTMGGSATSFTEIDHVDTHPAITLTKSSSAKDLSSAEEGFSRVQLRPSKSYGSLLRPVSLDKAIRVPVDYQFQQNTDDALVQVQPKGMLLTASSMDSEGSPELHSKQAPVMDSRMEPENDSPKGSAVYLNPAIVSMSSVVPQVLSPDQADRVTTSHMSPSHDHSGCVSSSSMYAGRQEHRHGDKGPMSANVFQ